MVLFLHRYIFTGYILCKKLKYYYQMAEEIEDIRCSVKYGMVLQAESCR